MLNCYFDDCLVTLYFTIYQFVLDMHIGPQRYWQAYRVASPFPFDWITKKWAEGLRVTSMATSRRNWAVVVSKGTVFTDQVLLSYSPLQRLADYSSFQNFPLKCLEPEDFDLIWFLALNF